MHDLSATTNDAQLLEDWADHRSESAFAALVEKYQALVFGAALRRSGQPDLARDAAQQVFSLIAQRARLLVGHTNIAGWLYRAASQIAARMIRSELRLRDRHERSMFYAASREENGDRWLPLEQALESLSARDREAIVLHYFQDLSYPEMAQALGIEATAARQRVSRALARLTEKLRRNGWTGSVPVLLAGASAWPAAANATALTGAAILGSTTAAPPLSLMFSAVISHSASKIAASVVAIALIPLALQWTTQTTLQAELAQANRATVPNTVAADVFDEQRLEDLRAKRIQAERRMAELAELAEKADDEILDSFGAVEELARKAGLLSRRLLNEDQNKNFAPPGTSEWSKIEAGMREMAEGLPGLIAAAHDLRRIERDPNKAGRFYATFLGELLELDDPTRQQLEGSMERWIARLQSEGLALPQRPKENTAAWDVRRFQAMHTQLSSIKSIIPPEAAARIAFLKSFKFDLKDAEDATLGMNMLFGGNQ